MEGLGVESPEGFAGALWAVQKTGGQEGKRAIVDDGNGRSLQTEAITRHAPAAVGWFWNANGLLEIANPHATSDSHHSCEAFT